MIRRPVLQRLSAGELAGGALAACAPGGAGGVAGPPAQGTAQAAAGAVSWMYSANPQTSGFDRIEAAFKTRYPQVALEGEGHSSEAP